MKSKSLNTPKFFWKIFRLSANPEDTFTECFAETMRQDSELARAVISFLFENRMDVKFKTKYVTTILTQKNFQKERSRPDMILELSNGVNVAIEIKLRARQSPGQLNKYLELPGINYVAYIRGEWIEEELESEVLIHNRYIKPEGKKHFRWHDFYDLVTNRVKEYGLPLTLLFQDLLEQSGYKPVIAEDGKWEEARSGDSEVIQFREWYFEPLVESLKTRGWKIGERGRSRREVNTRWDSAGKVKKIFVNNWSYANTLKVSLDLDMSYNLDKVLKRLDKSTSLPNENISTETGGLGKKRNTYHFFITRENLMDGTSSNEDKRNRIKDYVLALHDTYK